MVPHDPAPTTATLIGMGAAYSGAYDALVRAVALIPVKSFAAAKLRLSAVMTASQRARLAEATATRVVAAAAGMPTFVVCEDDQVASWARGLGATVLWHPGEGLNGAVSAALAELADAGHDYAVVAHSDLPLAPPLHTLVTPGSITLAPDRLDDGTNVLTVPLGSGFEVSYGPGSFHRHLEHALGLPYSVRVHRSPDTALDIDTPADLDEPLVAQFVRSLCEDAS